MAKGGAKSQLCCGYFAGDASGFPTRERSWLLSQRAIDDNI